MEHVRRPAPSEALQTAIDDLAANVAVLDADGCIVAVNEAWVRFATDNGDRGGLRTGPGRNYLTCIDCDAAIDGSTARAAVDGVRSVLSGSANSFALEYPCHSPQREAWFVMLVAQFGAHGVVVAHVDVTPDHRPLHDPMSPTPSGALVTGQVELAIAAAQPNADEIAVLYVDVDDFKEVNDSIGHDAADALLVAVAARLRQVAGARSMVRRFASDEFVVVAPGATRSAAGQLAARIGQEMRAPFELGSDTAMITVSVGVAHYPDDAATAADLVRRADDAMGESKRQGRDTWLFHDDTVARRRSRRLALSRGLRRSMSDQQLRMTYQPQVRLADGAAVGLEALLRWDCPELGDPSPAEFVPVAESTGRILPIGWWALSAAVAQVAQWRSAGLHPGVLAVNVSARHFGQPHFADRVLELLTRFDQPAEQLELEVTETSAIRQREAGLQAMGQLTQAGVCLALDDFGTGYSSLANLSVFPLCTAKIDSTFVARIDGEPDSRPRVAAMVDLIQSMGLRCVAEGVQTQAQDDFLRACHCDVVQGFSYAPPLRPEEVVTWLHDRS
ncbi:MAG: bifunctional diguanylate cyclase/phosphodiesterase [Candidatus Nanopelagicales bacterium]